MGNKRAPRPAPGRQRTRRKKCRIWKNLLRLLADVSQDAAVNVQDEAVDEVGSGRSQEDSGSAQILGLAPAACGGLGNDELGGPAVFLASEASDFVNGLILYVDGGILAYIGKQPQ